MGCGLVLWAPDGLRTACDPKEMNLQNANSHRAVSIHQNGAPCARRMERNLHTRPALPHDRGPRRGWRVIPVVCQSSPPTVRQVQRSRLLDRAHGEEEEPFPVGVPRACLSF